MLYAKSQSFRNVIGLSILRVMGFLIVFASFLIIFWLRDTLGFSNQTSRENDESQDNVEQVVTLGSGDSTVKI